MGGSDADNLTLGVMQLLVQIKELEVVAVVGDGNPHLQVLKRCASESAAEVRIVKNVMNMAELMAWADLAIIAAGGTLWELLCVGCPVLSFARNSLQAGILSSLDRSQVVHFLGYANAFNRSVLATTIGDVVSDPLRRARMSERGRNMIDGRGAETSMQNSAGETVNFVVTMESIAPAESGAFLKMAESHFRELDSSFVPRQDWGKNYFTIIQSNPHFYLRWIAVNDARAGFILFGLEDHNFLANTSGWIYELYVLPEFRRKGVARESALRAIWNYKPTLLKSSSRSWKEIKALRHYGNHWVLENSANVGLSGTSQSEGCHLTTDLPTLAWLF